ncbi:MAG: hypothetical protein AAB759_02915 [Patescibacteria group bacterium]
MVKLFVMTVLMVSGLYPVPVGVTKADFPAQGGSASGGELRIAAEAKSEVDQAWKVWVTAYSSSEDETDSTPFTTALGTQVRDGIIATNMLPFGTKVKIPALFGNKIFVVEDRMHRRKTNFVDVWMDSKEKAIKFGSNYTEIIILK